MKSLFLFLFIISTSICEAQVSLKREFEFAAKQLKVAMMEIDNLSKEQQKKAIQHQIKKPEALVSPRSVDENGELIAVPSKDWTSGFFPGELWYLYEYTKEHDWQKAARKYTEMLEQEKLNGKTHDMGFKMYCSFGNGYRLTKDKKYRDILLQSANTLASRYNPTVKSIRSWNHNSNKWKFPVIIDNMMNLELLFWATRETKDSTYYNIAVNHAQTTLKNHFRYDYSCYHVVGYDPESGEAIQKNTHQGYSDDSAWARGQAWALYGYTMCFRESGLPEFLKQAKYVTNYIFTHPNLPNDLIPYWDYDAPQIPNEPRDVSAATVTASALYELSLYDSENGNRYLNWANTILKNISENYSAKEGEHHGFLLLHSTGSKPSNLEVDKPLSYADYYFLEALLRKQKLERKKNLF